MVFECVLLNKLALIRVLLQCSNCHSMRVFGRSKAEDLTNPVPETKFIIFQYKQVQDVREFKFGVRILQETGK